MLVKFLKAVTAADHPPAGRTFAEGEVCDLPDDQAQRWIRRQVATEEKAKTTKAANTAAPPAPSLPADYESWTLEDLHTEATKRDLHGRSGLDKAGLVKALQRSDKDAHGKK